MPFPELVRFNVPPYTYYSPAFNHLHFIVLRYCFGFSYINICVRMYMYMYMKRPKQQFYVIHQKSENACLVSFSFSKRSFSTPLCYCNCCWPGIWHHCLDPIPYCPILFHMFASPRIMLFAFFFLFGFNAAAHKTLFHLVQLLLLLFICSLVPF